MRTLARHCAGAAAAAAAQRCCPSIAEARVLTGIASLSTLSSHSSDHSSRGPWFGLTALGLGTALALGVGSKHEAHAKAADPQKKAVEATAVSAPAAAAPASQKKKLPVFSKEEVAKHRTPETGIWVTHKGEVFDITQFVALHPGGAQKIMLAAGGSVDPFWAMYQQHNKAEVKELLAPYRIGSLEGGAVAGPPIADPYAKEPSRHPALLPRSEKPYNAEPPGHILAANIITPTDMFFVRNHLPVPEVDVATYRLRIEGEGIRTIELSLEELKSRFKKYTVTANVQCTGNRRNELKAIKPIKGLDWDAGAIGCAVWGGVRLRDVLKAAGLDDDEQSVVHVHFVGLDKDLTTGDMYAASIPVQNAMSPTGDVLLAYEMNGEPLSRDHGYPLRTIVPGVTGARNIKWLGKVVTSKTENQSHWQQYDYKSFSPGVDWDTVDWSSAPAIQDVPITSAVTEPSPHEEVYAVDGEVTARGYSWSGGGRDVIRVDVSLDDGKTWEVAQLKKVPGQGIGRAWAWTLWEATVPLPKGSKAGDKLEVICRAVDSSYNSQPDNLAALWNIRGVVNNGWHRVPIKVV